LLLPLVQQNRYRQYDYEYQKQIEGSAFIDNRAFTGNPFLLESALCATFFVSILAHINLTTKIPGHEISF
jgi:hypothetical protein